MEVIAGDFGLEWKRKDGEIHKADYDDLLMAYDKLTTLQRVPCIAEIRNRVIEEVLEKYPKAICADCGYLNGHECTYEGPNCAVSKPILETVTKVLEQMKEVGE